MITSKPVVLGVHEPQSTRNVIAPGCQAWDRETCERVLIIGPDFDGFKDWTKMIDPMYDIEHWSVLVATKDAEGWDYYNMPDDTKVRYAHSSNLVVTASAGWYCRIAVIVDQTPQF